MSQQPVQLSLPEPLYQRIQRIADTSHRSVEAVMLDSLSLLFGALDDLPTAQEMESYTDDQLWALAYRRMNSLEEERLHELTALARAGELSPAEKDELDAALALVDQYMLMRSRALVLLKQHGQDVAGYLNASD
jgi:hypothetical protein